MLPRLKRIEVKWHKDHVTWNLLITWYWRWPHFVDLFAFTVCECTYRLMEQCPTWEANSRSASEEFSRLLALYGTRSFITVFRSSHRWNLSWATEFIQDTFSIFSHVRLGLPSVHFLSCFATKILYAFLISVPCVSHAYTISLSYRCDEEWKVWSSSLCIALQLPVTPALLGPNILLRTPFSKHPQSVSSP